MPATTTSPSRRSFLRRVAGLAVGLPLIAPLVGMLRRAREQERPAAIRIPADVPVGLSIAGAAVVDRQVDGSLRAFAARCTHLGCRIDRVIAGEAACPCHGSRFRPDGTVAAGPASRPLERLRVEPDAASGGWVATGGK